MSDTCPQCNTTVTELIVKKKDLDIKPAWEVSCPNCDTTLSHIESEEMKELTALQ